MLLTDTNVSSHDSSRSNLDYNLGQNKMEEQANRPPKAPPPPKKKFEDEATQYFPILHWGRGGGINFQSLLSKILYSGRVMNFALHCVGFFSLWLSQLKEFLGCKN